MNNNVTPMKNIFLKVLMGILLVVVSVFVVAQTRNTLAARDYIGKAVRDRDVFTVSGEGKVTSKPDLAKVDLGVLSDGLTVAAIQQDNTQKTNAIIAAIKALGVSADDIQTSNYNLQPKYDYTNGKQNIIGYTLSQTVNVKIRDLTKVGDVLQKATNLGANQVYGIQFTIDDPTTLQDQARLKAIDAARKKAQTLADALGLHIVKVVTFSESSQGVPGPIPYGIGGGAMMADKALSVPSVEPGSLDVTTDVSVTFEVR